MNQSQPSDDDARQLEEIVAYLDGELSPQESAQIERRLASDESYRRQLQGIERAWAALDELPTATVDDSFSKTTMELVVGAARSEVQQRTQALPVERRNRRLSAVMVATVAALLGALAYRVNTENPNRALDADLPVIEYIDIYCQFQGADFLRQLRRELGEGGWAGAGGEQAAQAFDQFQLVSSSERCTEWLDSLPEDARVSLRAKFNRFRALSHEQQERLRALHREIESAPDAAELQQTMLEYQEWLNGLPQSEQFELREKESEDRVRQVVERVRREERDKALDLSPEELEHLFTTVRPLLRQMRERDEEGRSRRERDDFDSSWVRGELWRFVRQNTPEIIALNRAVREALPERVRERYEQLPRREQWDRFFGWMRQMVRQRDDDRGPGGRRRRGDPSEQQLEEFFVEEVDAPKKERLLAMPRERMLQVLRRMYDGHLSSRTWNEPDDDDRQRRRADGPPRFQDRRGEFRGDRLPPERGPRDQPPRFPPDRPPGPPPPPEN